MNIGNLAGKGIVTSSLRNGGENTHTAVQHPAVTSSPNVRVEVVNVSVEIGVGIEERRALKQPLVDTEFEKLVLGDVCANVWD